MTESSDTTFRDPGLPEHPPRRADRDPKAARMHEWQTVGLLLFSMAGTALAVWAYFTVPLGDTPGEMRLFNLLFGVGIFASMFGIGAAAIQWARTLMKDEEVSESRYPLRSSEETREAAVDMLKEGAEESGVVGRRSLLKASMVGALAIAPLSVLVPMIGSLGGDYNVSKFRHTFWKKGVRLARDPDGAPIKAKDVTVGSIFHVIPEGLKKADHYLEEKAKAVVVLIKLPKGVQKVQAGREDWSFDGIVAYSKICTHVGCPVALYEQNTHHLLCPCHQSTFDVADGAKVVFGPAKRPLPQLPIMVDSEGYIVARSDFHEPIGPSFWEREK